jgi:preprotein translocase subunit Sec63
MRRVYQLSRRMAPKATLRDRHTALHVTYQSLKRDRVFCFVFVMALILTLVWWYLERWVGMVVDEDPYEILGLTPPVSIKEIKKAYRRKAMRYHFD